jgi:hypothetical protein
MNTPTPYSALVHQFQAAPPGKLYSIIGTDSSVFRLSLSMASQALLRGVPIAVVDGSNRFDAYMIAEAARQITAGRSGRRVTPEELLNRIYVARAFTCYQMEATITERLPAFLKRIHAPVAMVFGLLDTFYDDQAPLFEVKASLERIIAALHSMKQENISLLLASKEIRVESKERNTLLPRLLSSLDQVYSIEQDGGGWPGGDRSAKVQRRQGSYAIVGR